MSRRRVRWTPRAQRLIALVPVAFVLLGIASVVAVAIWSGVLTGNLDPP